MTTGTKPDQEESLGYRERSDALTTRIEAHKRFSNFSLEDWLEKHLFFKAGDVILDIGCGNGNLFPVYARKLGVQGVFVGIDKAPELLAAAAGSSGATPRVLLEWNMNNRFPFIEGSFDYVISSFAIYYAEKVKFILWEIKRILKAGGKFLFIGPTENNARELSEFNRMVFGFARDEKTNRRTNRLEKEFYPEAISLFEEVGIESIPSKLVFPDKDEFIKYYLATLLFEESALTVGFRPQLEEIRGIEVPSLAISKEMVAVWGKK